MAPIVWWGQVRWRPRKGCQRLLSTRQGHSMAGPEPPEGLEARALLRGRGILEGFKASPARESIGFGVTWWNVGRVRMSVCHTRRAGVVGRARGDPRGRGRIHGRVGCSSGADCSDRDTAGRVAIAARVEVFAQVDAMRSACLSPTGIPVWAMARAPVAIDVAASAVGLPTNDQAKFVGHAVDVDGLNGLGRRLGVWILRSHGRFSHGLRTWGKENRNPDGQRCHNARRTLPEGWGNEVRSRARRGENEVGTVLGRVLGQAA